MSSPGPGIALRLKIALIVGAMVAGAATGRAQNQQTQPPATPPAAPGSPQTIPEKTPSSPGTDGAGGNLTEKLGQTGGVIKPPEHIDPGMAKPAPPTPQSMPVIKPPEDKGGPVAK